MAHFLSSWTHKPSSLHDAYWTSRAAVCLRPLTFDGFLLWCKLLCFLSHLALDPPRLAFFPTLLSLCFNQPRGMLRFVSFTNRARTICWIVEGWKSDFLLFMMHNRCSLIACTTDSLLCDGYINSRGCASSLNNGELTLASSRSIEFFVSYWKIRIITCQVYEITLCNRALHVADLSCLNAQ